MGLLNRARVLDIDPDSVGVVSYVSEAEALAGSFRHSAEQLDYPVEVFDSFKKLLGFSKGTLLLPDPEKKEFYPWIASGLDRTTTRRLRIPENFPSLNNSMTGVVLTLESDELSSMLSNRESGLAGSIHVVALGNEGKIEGLVLSMDSRDFDIEMMNQATGILNKETGSKIARSREILGNVGSEDPVDPEEWLDSWGDREAWLVTLDATGAIEALMDAIEGLEVFRARRDVIGLIRRINGRMGRTYDLKDGRVLILFPAERMPDRELYIHQLSNAVCASILDLTEVPVFPVIFNRWPEEKDEVKSSLAGFFRE